MTLNEAIYEVLTTQFKKDAKEAHKMLTDYGYEVKKYCGRWYVKNPTTQKEISAFYNDWRYSWFFCYGYDKRIPMNRKIDFVNCLNTPINKNVYNYSFYINNFQRNADKLKSAKRSITYEEKRINEIKAEVQSLTERINVLQDRLVDATEEKGRRVRRLAEVRKELGLKGEN